MKPSELYARKEERRDHRIAVLGCNKWETRHRHIPEIEFDLLESDPNSRITIRYYKDFCFDGRRIWRMASVWYGDRPVMIIRNAGREGDDHHSRFVTDEALYGEMVEYLHTLALPSAKRPPEDLVDPETDIPDLESFYGWALDGAFERYR